MERRGRIYLSLALSLLKPCVYRVTNAAATPAFTFSVVGRVVVQTGRITFELLLLLLLLPVGFLSLLHSILQKGERKRKRKNVITGVF
jgi:hypothetical protein